MSELGLTPDEVVHEVSEDRVTICFFFVALSLAVYDIGLTLPQEVRCIWQRKFGTVAMLYLTIRYGTIFITFSRVFDGFYLYPTIPVCKTLAITTYIVTTFVKLAYAVFDSLRIWSITQHQWLPAVLVFVLAIFDPAVNIYNYACPSIDILIFTGPLAGCWSLKTVQAYTYLPLITRVISIAADGVVLALTLNATWKIFRASQESGTKTKLVSVLIHNGSMQFGIILLLNIISMILDVLSVASVLTSATQHQTNFVTLQEVVESILYARFILALRWVYHVDNSPSNFDTRSSVLVFASAIEANLGAATDDAWVTGVEREVEDKVVYTETPLAVGLFDTKTINAN